MITRVVALFALAALTAWACWPLPREPGLLAGESTPTAPSPAALLAFDRAAFAAPIWVEPPAPPPAPVPLPEPPAPKPPNIQLLGVATDDGQRCALVFDEAADRISTLHQGDRVAGCVITRIAETTLDVVNEQGHIFTLELKRQDPRR